jgi:hypothetical protein
VTSSRKVECWHGPDEVTKAREQQRVILSQTKYTTVPISKSLVLLFPWKTILPCVLFLLPLVVELGTDRGSLAVGRSCQIEPPEAERDIVTSPLSSAPRRPLPPSKSKVRSRGRRCLVLHSHPDPVQAAGIRSLQSSISIGLVSSQSSPPHLSPLLERHPRNPK